MAREPRERVAERLAGGDGAVVDGGPAAVAAPASTGMHDSGGAGGVTQDPARPPARRSPRPPGRPARPCRASPPGWPGTRRRGPSRCARSISVGRSSAHRVAVGAASISATSWPSISIAVQPNASARSRNTVAVPSVHRGTALPEPVQVEDRRQAAEPRGRTRPSPSPPRPIPRPSPSRPAGPRRVPARRPSASRAPSRAPTAKSLAERAGGDVDPRELRGSAPGVLGAASPSGEATAAPHRRWRRSPSASRTGRARHGPSTARTGRSRGRAGSCDVGAQVVGEQDREQVGARTCEEVGCPSPLPSCIGCCRRRSAPRGRSRAASDRPSVAPVRSCSSRTGQPTAGARNRVRRSARCTLVVHGSILRIVHPFLQGPGGVRARSSNPRQAGHPRAFPDPGDGDRRRDVRPRHAREVADRLRQDPRVRHPDRGAARTRRHEAPRRV